MALQYETGKGTVDIDQAVELAHAGRLPWDRDLVKRALWRAARALAAMRLVGDRDFPASRMSSWPDVVYTIEEKANHERQLSNRLRPTPPSPGEIDRMDEAICWLLCLTRHDRRIVWASASVRGCSWAWLGEMYGVSRDTAKRQHRRAIETILEEIHRAASGEKVA